MSKSYKTQEYKTTVSGAVSEAFGELQSLRDEMDEICGNMEEKFSQTERYQRYEEARGTLGNYADSEPEAHEDVAERDVVCSVLVHVRKKASPSRSVRLSNAVSLLQAAAGSLEEWVETCEDTDLEEEVDRFVTEIQEVADEVSQVEFPGMFG